MATSATSTTTVTATIDGVITTSTSGESGTAGEVLRAQLKTLQAELAVVEEQEQAAAAAEAATKLAAARAKTTIGESPTECKTLRLKTKLPEGMPGKEHFTVETTPSPMLEADGSILVQVLVMSADPYMRGGLKTAEDNSVIAGFVAGKVLGSKHADWDVGDLFGCHLPLSTVQLVDLSQANPWRLTGLISEDEISWGIGILGMPGATAYGGLIDILKPIEGQTLWVSGAAGAVGGLVGQLGKIHGLKVVGSAGGDAKCSLIKEKFGFDSAVDYKTTKDGVELIAALKEVAPDGIDMYFENVGGYHFQAAMALLRPKGRIALCGAISTYNENITYEPGTGPNSIMTTQMLYTFQRIEGFVCMPWLSGAKGDFLNDMHGWLREGKLAVEETVFEGIEEWGAGFQSLFTGGNTGKVVVKV